MHAKGCRMWCQLWAQGRAGHLAALESVGSKLMSASAVPLSGKGMPVPVEMTDEEIWATVQNYATAAKNAIEAGFDGVEIHGYRSSMQIIFPRLTRVQRQRLPTGSVPSDQLQQAYR